MGRSTRPPMTLGGRILVPVLGGGFALVFRLFGLVMAVPMLVGYGLYRLLDGILDDRRPLAPAIAVPFAHAVWGTIGLGFLVLTHRPLPPYAATEVGLLASFPFLLLYFPAIVPAVVIVAFQSLGICLHIDALLDPVAMAALLEEYGFPADEKGLRELQLATFAHIAYRVFSIAAVLGCLVAYYWPRTPRRRRTEDDVLDLMPVGGGYLSPWVRDADGNYRRG